LSGLSVQAGAYAEGRAQGQQDARELLEDCLAAFEAMPIAAKSRKLLKKWGMTPGAYAGSGSHILAEYMAKKLREHLGSQS
jgi:hypothetical protein